MVETVAEARANKSDRTEHVLSWLGSLAALSRFQQGMLVLDTEIKAGREEFCVERCVGPLEKPSRLIEALSNSSHLPLFSLNVV